MILLLVGSYVGLLWLLVKVGVFPRWYGWMKVSPVVVGVIAFMAIFLPLNWNAPVGGTTVTVGSVGIKPAVKTNPSTGAKITGIFSCAVISAMYFSLFAAGSVWSFARALASKRAS